MNHDVESAVDLALSHEERAVVALESIAEALTMWAKIEAQRFEKEYPPREPRESTVTHVKTEEEILREALGEDGSATIEEWTSLDGVGPRERSLLSKEKK